uniref:ATP-binding protein n=1 Tax=Ningiella ruwaisensis TaxID=2364274 RepID=UPI00109EFA9A|nr:ATP-binding protein [Ningiella ruwaisensis]
MQLNKVENQQFIQATRYATNAIVLLDKHANIAWVNEQAKHMFCERLHVNVSQSFFDIASKIVNRKNWSRIQQALEHGQAASEDLKIKVKTDLVYSFHFTIHPQFNGKDIHGFAVYVEDITHQYRLESQLRENSEILETIAKIANLGFYSLDIESNSLTWSDEVYNIHDLPIGYPISVEEAVTYYAPSARAVINKTVEQCLLSGEPFDLELPFITAKKREIWVRAVGYAQLIDGNPVELKGAFQDITHMRQAAIQANQAMRAKSAFLATMSHELRTPINGVIGLTELLSASQLSEKQQEYTRMILQSAQSLHYLVNQILDYSKLEANKLVVNSTLESIRNKVEEALYIHKVAAQKKGIAFELHIADDVPNYFTFDPFRLEQILNNLCSNAVKFTSSGRIEVNISLKDKHHVLFLVKDSGIGISEKDLSLLFIEFQQVDNTFSREFGGTGLGLSISKQLVEMMGGELGVNSQAGIGSEFWFSLPLGEFHHDAQPPVGVSFQPAIFFTPNEKMYEIMTTLAQQAPGKIVVENTPHALIQTIKNDRALISIFILDFPLAPSKASLLLHSVLRVTTSNQKLFATQSCLNTLHTEGFTKLDEVSEIDHELALCFDKFAENDFEPQAFYQALLHQQTPNKLDKTQVLAGRHFLIVEDNHINQIICTEMLKAANAKVSLAENGKQAIEILEEGPDFDAVIMDCQMPVMDGYEATRLIKHHQDEKLRNLTVIAATAHGFADDIQRCYDAGMVDVVIKPFTRSELIDTVTRNL